MQSKRRFSIGGLLALFILVAIAVLFWSQRLAIHDWLRLRNYTPPAAVAQLATDSSMNDQGRHLFYVYHPNLSDRLTFSENCNKEGEHSIVLGCYISGQALFIFDVNDARLAGVEEVTAAHEMLHVAYERLSTKDQAHINELTSQVYASLTNERLRKNVESYRAKDPSVVPNELHSILGTEVRNLPPELEQYYKRYFTDRAKVVALAEAYEQAFTEREARAVSLERQVQDVRSQIDNLESRLTTERARLEADRDTITDNAAVAAFNNRVQRYNSSLGELNELIDKHNALVDEYKQVVLEENDLIKALDSRPSAL